MIYIIEVRVWYIKPLFIFLFYIYKQNYIFIFIAVIVIIVVIILSLITFIECEEKPFTILIIIFYVRLV